MLIAHWIKIVVWPLFYEEVALTFRLIVVDQRLEMVLNLSLVHRGWISRAIWTHLYLLLRHELLLLLLVLHYRAVMVMFQVANRHVIVRDVLQHTSLVEHLRWRGHWRWYPTPSNFLGCLCRHYFFLAKRWRSTADDGWRVFQAFLICLCSFAAIAWIIMI